MSTEQEDNLNADEVREIVRDELDNEDGEEASGGRREFLQALGLGGLAAGVGGGTGYAARSAIEPASADASTSDSDGDVGTPSDRVDVFGEGIDTNSLDADELLSKGEPVQAALNGHVVPIAPGLGTGDAIDPSTTSTPVQDAITAIDNAYTNEGMGRVLLPPGVVQEAGTVDPPDGCKIVIQGQGNIGGKTDLAGGTQLEFTSTGTSAHGLSLSGNNDDCGFYDLTIAGPGSSATTGSAIYFTGNARGIHGDNVTFRGWNDHVINTNAKKTFDWNFGKLEFWDVSGGAIIYADDLGPQNDIKMLRIDGSPNYLIDQRNGQLRIATMNVGGDIGAGGPAGEAIRTHGGLTLVQLNFEPSGTFGGVNIIYHKFNNSPVRVESIVNWGSVEAVYTLESVGKGRYGPVQNKGTISVNVLRTNGDIVEPCRYDGSTSDFSGSGYTSIVHCLDGDVT